MNKSQVVRITIGALVGLSLFMAAGPVGAASGRVSQGEARAVLEAFGGGGLAIVNHHLAASGAPADSTVRASIRPFAGTLFDGRHYCAEDWHVIFATVAAGGDKSFSRQDALAQLNAEVIEFNLDGQTLPTTRTAIKRLVGPERFGLEEAYQFQQGVVLSPESLSVGGHDVAFSEWSPLTGLYTSQITLYIDAPGTGACLETPPL
jgi:hypothetical protein